MAANLASFGIEILKQASKKKARGARPENIAHNLGVLSVHGSFESCINQLISVGLLEMTPDCRVRITKTGRQALKD